jgi:hypothetical protein
MLISVACSSSVEPGASSASGVAAGPQASAPCVPGIQLTCQCADGSVGVTVCDEATRSLGTCGCGQDAAPGAASEAVRAQGESAPVTRPELARGIRIAELSIYQTVKVPLMRDGVTVLERNAPVIAGKEALLRVFVELLPGFQPRELSAKLELTSSAEPAKPLEVMQHIESNSSDAELTSSFNFVIPASSISATTRYAVSLWQSGAGPERVIDPANDPPIDPAIEPAGELPIDPLARWPATDGELDTLRPRDAGPLRIMFVPYRYTADGSDRLPEMDGATIARYKATLHGIYPASQIEFQMHDPVDYPGMIGPTTGWSEWLEFHCAMREREAPDPKVLYYGTVAPTEDFASYGGGIAGISPLPSAASNYGRCSVGLGFPDFESTMIHEIGHALGLEHAPCGTSGGPFPYDEARIGSWGLALPSKTLIEPSEYYDVMSYCDPVYISDYNYQRLFERIRYLNLQFDVAAAFPEPGAAGRYRRVLVDGGRARFRGSIDLVRAPADPDEARPITLLDENGRTLGQVPAYFFPFSEPDSGVWLIPARDGATTARIAQLGDVALR